LTTIDLLAALFRLAHLRDSGRLPGPRPTLAISASECGTPVCADVQLNRSRPDAFWFERKACARWYRAPRPWRSANCNGLTVVACALPGGQQVRTLLRLLEVLAS